MWTDTVESAPGTVDPGARFGAGADSFCQENQAAAIILVGHVTKDGQIAGPRVVEHMSGRRAVVRGRGRRSNSRILRAVKNRFGPTDEIGVFEDDGPRAFARSPIHPSCFYPSATRQSGIACRVPARGHPRAW